MSKDLERSLKDRIKAIAKAENRAFNDIWKTLVLERFLSRLFALGEIGTPDI